MADTFAYNPPGLPPAHSYGPAPPFQAAGAYGAIEDLSDEDRGTSLGTGSTSVDGYKHDELLPRGGSTSPPPLAPSLYSYGANVRSGMRPMTAPSSTSAPYFHAAHYSNAGSSNASAFGAPQHAATYYSYSSENPAAQAAEEYRRQYYAAGLRGDHYAGLPDEPRYRDTSTEPTFQHSIPPQQQQQRYYEPVQSGSPDDGAYSRPRTGESRPRSTQPPLPLTSSHAESAHPSKLYEQSERHEDGAYQDPEVDELETKAYSFVTTAGQAPKRPRRRYEEIERLYTCDYHGCQKAYGTLNHLNSHKTMQRHGPKSTPAQFKELRKAWRDNKKAAAAASRNPSESPTAFVHPQSPPSVRRPSTTGSELTYGDTMSHNPFAHPIPFRAPILTPNIQFSMPPAQQPSSNGWDGLAAIYDGYRPQPQRSLSLSAAHRPVTAPSYLANPPSFGFHPSSFAGSASGQGGYPQLSVLQGMRRASLPGVPSSSSFYVGGDDGFGSIQEESGYADGQLKEEGYDEA